MTAINDISSLNYLDSNFNHNYVKVLNYLNQELTQDELLNALIEFSRKYCNINLTKSQLNNYTSNVECKIAYCIINGAKLKEDSINKVKTLISTLNNKIDNCVNLEELPETIQSRRAHIFNVCSGLISNARSKVVNNKISIEEYRDYIKLVLDHKTENSKAIIVNQLIDYFKEYYDNVKDSNLYSQIEKQTLLMAYNYLYFLKSNSDNIKSSNKIKGEFKLNQTFDQFDARGEKSAKKVKFKAIHESTGIQSIDPVNIVGSKLAIIYDSSSERCEVYMSNNNQLLSFDGSKIINYDPIKSSGRKIRNVDKTLPIWAASTTATRVNVLLNTTSGKKWEVSGRINKNSLVIKILN